MPIDLLWLKKQLANLWTRVRESYIYDMDK